MAVPRDRAMREMKVRLPVEWVAWLHYTSLVRGRSVSTLVLDALEAQYPRRLPPSPRDSL